MERFEIKIQKIKKSEDSRSLIIVFDVILNGTKVGEAERDQTDLNGELMKMFSEYTSNMFYTRISDSFKLPSEV